MFLKQNGMMLVTIYNNYIANYCRFSNQNLEGFTMLEAKVASFSG